MIRSSRGRPCSGARAASSSRRRRIRSSWRRYAPPPPGGPTSTRASARGWRPRPGPPRTRSAGGRGPRGGSPAPTASGGGRDADGERRVGSRFAGHRIDAVAGRGGMGVVYRATDLTLDRPVALKLLTPSLARDPVFRARFERECRLAAALDHPNVVPIFHAGAERGALYLTMRYIERTDLRPWLAAERRLEPTRAARIIAQVAGALTEAHRHGLVHRDVKPANVLIAKRDDDEHAFLTDFGITMDRAGAAHLTNTGFAVGTADYMSPEQARGADVAPRADVYALGCVLYRALTGAVLYDKESDVEKMWAHVHEPPPALLDVCPELPASLGDAVERALAKIPADRQQSAAELAHDVLAATG